MLRLGFQACFHRAGGPSMRVSLTAALQISSSIGLNLAGPYDRVNATTSPVRDRIDDSAVGGVPRDLVVVLVCNLHPAWRYRCFTSSGPLFSTAQSRRSRCYVAFSFRRSLMESAFRNSEAVMVPSFSSLLSPRPERQATLPVQLIQ
jgi:hypothetical protein